MSKRLIPSLFTYYYIALRQHCQDKSYLFFLFSLGRCLGWCEKVCCCVGWFGGSL